ncbi:hypothetical protein BT67DRAFT_435611 [Trichocladium antarcticum]|uniref:RING-type domain-containing protein n=1 Tax=Trichocladium antarcticum TaxID=1450529 RepID=A0AAN6UGL0_9PEZI|nr:hypothetical protein BT67DRAFT_435611 [Trichocladium antarcticum]
MSGEGSRPKVQQPTPIPISTSLQLTRTQCAVCLERFEHGAIRVCRNRHDWCRGCLHNAVETALRSVSDPTCMPVQCCGDRILPMEDAEAVRRARAAGDTQAVIDRSVIRMAQNTKSRGLFQFCQRCHRLVSRAEGCNHMTCVCGHDFCIICGGDWITLPDRDGVIGASYCHPFFGSQEEHHLRIPAAVQQRLDDQDRERERQAAARDEEETIICIHDAELLTSLRLKREESRQARCHLCGVKFRGFLLHCLGCETIMCLGCRDALIDGDFWK